MARRSYSGTAQPTVLTGSITNVAGSFTTAAATGFPDGTAGPFVVTLDRGLASEEKVLISSRTGTTFTVSSRGYDGTTGVSHANSATVEHTISAVDLDEANAHGNAAVGQAHADLTVSGSLNVTGTVAGSVTQTITGADGQSANLLNLKGFNGTLFSYFDGDGDLWLTFVGVGTRQLEVGAPDSGGTGYRLVRIAN